MQTLYIWQPGNDPLAQWNVALSLDEIPDGIKFRVYSFVRKGKAKHSVTEEAD